jgi:hypothetical protein
MNEPTASPSAGRGKEAVPMGEGPIHRPGVPRAGRGKEAVRLFGEYVWLGAPLGAGHRIYCVDVRRGSGAPGRVVRYFVGASSRASAVAQVRSYEWRTFGGAVVLLGAVRT